MTLVELEDAALKLDQSERAHLAERLLRSLGDPEEPELEALWADEAERRDRAIDRGELQSSSLEQVMGEIRAGYGWPGSSR